MKLNFTLVLLVLFFNTVNAQLTDSNLPVVIITTDNDPGTGLPLDIPDDPKILASMKIIYRPDGSRNYLTDENTASFLNYSGRIGIEIRGSTSQLLPKKAYSLTTLKNDNVSSNNVSILNMPAENDWVLNSLAFDETLLRDYLTYDMARAIGNYAARGRYCEVIINGDYKGLYVFMEKLKINTDRINILKMGSTDNSLPNVSGGYITKCDKTDGPPLDDPIAWSFPTNDPAKTADFIHESPKPASITPQQNAYIYNWFSSLETEAQNQNASIVNGFPALIDIPSFVDFILMNELTSNVDAYQTSTYFHKDRNGKLRAGPVWDFNFAYGYDYFGDRSRSDVWQFDNGDNLGAKFWKNLFNDPVFHCYLVKRWNELTSPGNIFDFTSISSQIDANVTLITEAMIREEARWDWHTYFDLFHNPNIFGYYAINYTAGIDNMKTWLQNRINWISSNIGNTASCTFPSTPNLVISKIHYNPLASGSFTGNNLEFIELTNNSNVNVDVSGYYFRELGITYIFPANSILLPNSKIYLASDANSFMQFYGKTPFGVFTRNLSNKSQKLSLADPYGNIVDYVEYSDSSPWPSAADGTGPYLSLIDLSYDNSLASSWTTSVRSLPIKLISFTGKTNNGINQLKWQTAAETNNHHFDIERSIDGRSFEKIGTVTGAGNSYTTKTYYFDDSNPFTGNNYYRLKQTDIDGLFEYSYVIIIKNTKSVSFSVYPNPAHDQLYLKGIKNKNTAYTIKNAVGQTMLKGNTGPDNTVHTEVLNKGLYYILINGKAVKFIKQ